MPKVTNTAFKIVSSYNNNYDKIRELHDGNTYQSKSYKFSRIKPLIILTSNSSLRYNIPYVIVIGKYFFCKNFEEFFLHDVEDMTMKIELKFPLSDESIAPVWNDIYLQVYGSFSIDEDNKPYIFVNFCKLVYPHEYLSCVQIHSMITDLFYPKFVEKIIK